MLSLLQDFLKGINISCENSKTLPQCLLQTRENTFVGWFCVVFFFPKAHLSLKSKQALWHVYIWEGWCGGGGGSIIYAREDYLGTAHFCWETQHLKSPGATPMQEKRCCHVDELWLVGKQVQERSSNHPEFESGVKENKSSLRYFC